MTKFTLAIALLLTTFGIHASADADKEALAKRLAPVGQVYVAGAAAAPAAPGRVAHRGPRAHRYTSRSR